MEAARAWALLLLLLSNFLDADPVQKRTGEVNSHPRATTGVSEPVVDGTEKAVELETWVLLSLLP